MTVWVVVKHGMFNRGAMVEGVYSTPEKAEKVMEKIDEINSVSIYEAVVDEELGNLCG